MVKAYEAACPILKHKAGKSVPYYTSEDKKQRRVVRQQFNKCKNSTDKSPYYNELRKYSKNLRVRERTGWRNQCSAISGVHDSAKMFKILSKDPGRTIGSLLLPSGAYTKDQNETYQHLLDFHLPDCKPLAGLDPNTVRTLTAGETDSALIDRIITEDRIRWAIDQFKPFKSPGSDGILPAMLKQVFEVTKYSRVK